MERPSKVFSDKLMELVCHKSLTVAHNEKEEAHRGKRIMPIDNHKKGSEGSYRKSHHDKLDRETIFMKIQLELMRELLQKDNETMDMDGLYREE